MKRSTGEKNGSGEKNGIKTVIKLVVEKSINGGEFVTSTHDWAVTFDQSIGTNDKSVEVTGKTQSSIKELDSLLGLTKNGIPFESSKFSREVVFHLPGKPETIQMLQKILDTISESEVTNAISSTEEDLEEQRKVLNSSGQPPTKKKSSGNYFVLDSSSKNKPTSITKNPDDQLDKMFPGWDSDLPGSPERERPLEKTPKTPQKRARRFHIKQEPSSQQDPIPPQEPIEDGEGTIHTMTIPKFSLDSNEDEEGGAEIEQPKKTTNKGKSKKKTTPSIDL